MRRETYNCSTKRLHQCAAVLFLRGVGYNRRMLYSVKKRLYFVVAAYFAFWAKFVLRRWHPRVIVVTGSTGKTTLFSLIEAQLGNKAFYSHHANSSHGLPFLVLGFEPNILNRVDWLKRFILAPIKAWRQPPPQRFFVAEADTDRPHEGDFISKFLRPEVTLWVSVYRTHSMNFDAQVRAGRFPSHEAAIAYDFGWFAARTSKLVIANGDQTVIKNELRRVGGGVEIILVKSTNLKEYKFQNDATEFVIGKRAITLPGLHPRELGNSLQMVNGLLGYLQLPLDPNYTNLHMPPGRSHVFTGKKGITIIDSTYNTGLDAMTAILKLFMEYPADHKWVVLGDILEQGSLEQQEHEGLARAIVAVKPEHIVLLGPRSGKWTVPLVRQLLPSTPLDTFDSPKDVLDYLNQHLKGSETLLFKGGRFLEGVIEQLLANPADAANLVRRDAVWTRRRQRWGLPR